MCHFILLLGPVKAKLGFIIKLNIKLTWTRKETKESFKVSLHIRTHIVYTNGSM